jgi:hypothetical protein
MKIRKYEQKSFITLAQGMNDIKRFSLSLMKIQNKLEGLYLASLSSHAQYFSEKS